MVEKTSHCKKCDKVKNIKCFYRNNMSQCKICKDEINKKNRYGKNDVVYILEGLYNKINNIEIIYEELNKKIKEINNDKYNNDVNNISIFLNFIVEIIILQENTYSNKKELIDAVMDFMKYNNIEINKRLNYIYTNFKNNDEVLNKTSKNETVDRYIDKNNNNLNNDYELKLNDILNDTDDYI